MADLSVPFLGNPNLARQAAKGRESFAKQELATDLDPSGSNLLAQFFRGLMGVEDTTSALNPQAESMRDMHYGGAQIGNVLTGAGLPAFQVARSSTGLPRMAQGSRSAQRGAVTIGGPKDLVAMHAFAPGKADAIADTGGLIAPSIGITSRAANDYSKYNPNFVFRAGFLDPAKQGGTLINRDGFFANPTGRVYKDGSGGFFHSGEFEFSPTKLAQEVAELRARGKRKLGTDDLRLLQGLPSEPGQTLAIGASPSFESMRAFEQSPFGAGALRQSAKNRGEKWSQIENELVDLTPPKIDPDESAVGLIRGANTAPEELNGRARELWQMAREAPSAMAEYKMYGMQPVTPNDAYILLNDMNGRGMALDDAMEGLTKMRDQGFSFGRTSDLSYPQQGLGLDEWAKGLPGTVPNTGELRPPLLGQGYEGSTARPTAHEMRFFDWAAQGPRGDDVLTPGLKASRIGPPRALFEKAKQREEILRWAEDAMQPPKDPVEVWKTLNHQLVK